MRSWYRLKQAWQRGWVFGLSLIILIVAGCQPTPSPTSTPPPTLTPTPVPDKPTYALNTQQSIVRYTATGALNVTFPGTFAVKAGTVIFEPETSGTRILIDVVIDGNSITAVNDLVRNALRNNLEVDKFPEARFVAQSTTLVKLVEGKASFTAKGDLTLHGVTRAVEMPFTLSLENDVLTASGEMKLDLLDFQVSVPTAILNSKITFRAEVKGSLVK